ncbi:hypothetical protein EDD85DRAFT_984642, partial [Armillaria nabsnona]
SRCWGTRLVRRYIYEHDAVREVLFALQGHDNTSMATWRVPNICDYSLTSPPVSRISGIDFNGLLDQSRANTEKLRLALDEAGGDAIQKASGCHREGFAWPLEKRASMSGFDGGRSVLKKVSGEEMTRTHLWRIYFVTCRVFQQTLMASPSLWAENAVETWVEELRLQTARRLELEKLVLLPLILAHPKNLPEPLASEETREDPEG